MPAPPRPAAPSAALIPAAPELRFRLSVPLRDVELLRKLLRVAEAVETDCEPAAVKLFHFSAPAEMAVPRE